MNPKQLTTLLTLLIIIGGLGLLLLTRDRQTWQPDNPQNPKTLPNFPLNDITTITIQDTNQQLNLTKTNNIWTVSNRWNYPADFTKIGDLLQTIWDLKTTRPINAGPTQHGRLGLIPPTPTPTTTQTNTQTPTETDTQTNTNTETPTITPTPTNPPPDPDTIGTLLTFHNQNQTQLTQLLLGKTDEYKGRYILPNNNPDAIGYVTETFTTIQTDPTQWLDKTFLQIQKLKTATITHPNPDHSWTITRTNDTADMTLTNLPPDQQLDPAKTYTLKNILSNPTFTDIHNPNTPTTENDNQPPITATLTTFDNFTYNITLGKPNDQDQYPLTYTVTAQIPDQRQKPEDETEEDTQRLDQEFQENKDKLTKKLTQEQTQQPWTYLLSKWTIDALLYTREDLIQKPEPEEEQPTTQTTPPNPNNPTTTTPHITLPNDQPPNPADPNNIQQTIQQITNPLPDNPTPEPPPQEK